MDEWRHLETSRGEACTDSKTSSCKDQKAESGCNKHVQKKKNHEIKRSCRTYKRRKIEKKYTRNRGSSRAKGYEEGIWLCKAASGRRTTQSKPVKDTNGVVLTRIDDQLNQWKEYFREVFNRPAPETPPALTEGPQLGIRAGHITMTEVKRSLKVLKNGKAAGCDNIAQRPGRREDWFHPRFSTPSSVRSGMRRSSLSIGSWASWFNFPRRGDLSLCKN